MADCPHGNIYPSACNDCILRRDLFAAAALAGLLANSGTSVPVAGFSLVAALAVKISDATIAELDKPQT